MGFDMGTDWGRPDAGRLKGMQREIACKCWYTVSGRSMPLMFQVRDEEGQVHTIRDIRVLYSEKKRYAGVPTVEYACSIAYHGMRREVKLVFFVEENRWVLIGA